MARDVETTLGTFPGLAFLLRYGGEAEGVGPSAVFERRGTGA